MAWKVRGVLKRWKAAAACDQQVLTRCRDGQAGGRKNEKEGLKE